MGEKPAIWFGGLSSTALFESSSTHARHVTCVRCVREIRERVPSCSSDNFVALPHGLRGKSSEWSPSLRGTRSNDRSSEQLHVR
jgi:hypothetical protein